MRPSLGLLCLLLACDHTLTDTADDTLSAAGEACAIEADCADGLVCLGEHALGGEGWCVPSEQAGTFTATPRQDIPDASSVGVQSTLTASGLADVAVDVVVTLGVSHARPSDLTVTLTSPGGATAAVVSGADAASGAFVVRGLPAGEPANGDWTLSVTDPVRGQEGLLSLWQLSIVSAW